MKDSGDNVFYTRSDDGALTWSTILSFPDIQYNSNPIITSYHKYNLYAAYEEGSKIFLTISPDKGVTWSAQLDVFTNNNPVSNVSIHSDGDNLFIVFEEHLYVDQLDDFQTDLCYKRSINNGENWSEKIKYTKSIANEYISEINFSSGKLYTTILSNRVNVNNSETYLGILDLTKDPAPPIVFWSEIPSSIDFDRDFTIRIFAIDETGIESVTAAYNDEVYTLYDDGNHGDDSAGDNIFGAIIPGFPSNFSFDPARSLAVAVNNIILPVYNNGVLASVNVAVTKGLTIDITDIDDNIVSRSKNIIYREISGSNGKYDGKNILFGGGFYISGFAGDLMWANTVTSGSLLIDYQAGLIGSDPKYPDNLVYSVRSDDPPFGKSWQNWNKSVEQGAYFYDGDGDGIYNPVDKNGNGVWDSNEDKPDILYDGVYFTVYNDGIPASERRFESIDPLGIEVRQSIYASYRNTILDDVVFIRYSLLYKGLGGPVEPDSLTKVYFSVFTDTDIGDASDDKPACDTTLHSGYIYNDGSDYVFGVNPPAVFKTVVQGPISKTGNSTDYGYNKFGPDIGIQSYQGYKNLGMTSFVAPQKSSPYLRDPYSPSSVRYYQHGLDNYGEKVDPCELVIGEVRGGLDCADVDSKFWFSGDPVTDYGWIYKNSMDARDMINTGPFDLVKNEPMDIIVAYVVGRGIDHLNSIDRAREITQYVHEEYQRNFSTLVSVEDKHEELPAKFYLSQNYPNPFNPATKINYTIGVVDENFRPLQTQLIVYDILGREVKTLVNEVKAPGTYEITFDASQLASGVYFYRFTSGNLVQTKKMILLR
ncbi:hypothetical protein ASZ90_004653 [hydrocarbon metagenome]|uniref:Secretion system C-terminal sorting domain-containing protein n=1 Tax=hydrocarbon metagenome TaxID=938273 RepID=A0A0W8FXF0_9ZZZZ